MERRPSSGPSFGAARACGRCAERSLRRRRGNYRRGGNDSSSAGSHRSGRSMPRLGAILPVLRVRGKRLRRLVQPGALEEGRDEGKELRWVRAGGSHLPRSSRGRQRTRCRHWSLPLLRRAAPSRLRVRGASSGKGIRETARTRTRELEGSSSDTGHSSTVPSESKMLRSAVSAGMRLAGARSLTSSARIFADEAKASSAAAAFSQKFAQYAPSTMAPPNYPSEFRECPRVVVCDKMLAPERRAPRNETRLRAAMPLGRS